MEATKAEDAPESEGRFEQMDPERRQFLGKYTKQFKLIA